MSLAKIEKSCFWLFQESLFMPGFTPCKGQAGFGWRSGIVGSLRLENYCSLHNRAGKLPTPHVLGQNREGLLLAFSGVPY